MTPEEYAREHPEPEPCEHEPEDWDSGMSMIKKHVNDYDTFHTVHVCKKCHCLYVEY